MNNREKYKKAFSVLHTSDTNLSWEVKSMAKMKRNIRRCEIFSVNFTPSTRPTFNDFFSFPNRVCLDIKTFTVTIRNLE